MQSYLLSHTSPLSPSSLLSKTNTSRSVWVELIKAPSFGIIFLAYDGATSLCFICALGSVWTCLVAWCGKSWDCPWIQRLWRLPVHHTSLSMPLPHHTGSLRLDFYHFLIPCHGWYTLHTSRFQLTHPPKRFHLKSHFVMSGSKSCLICLSWDLFFCFLSKNDILGGTSCYIYICGSNTDRSQ